MSTTPSATPSAPGATPRSAARTISAGLALIEAVVLVGFAVFYLAELAVGGGDDTARVVTSALVIVIAAVGLAGLARGWWVAATWARTPTLVWNVLLLPVGASLLQSAQVLIGSLVLVVAILSLVAAIASGVRTQGPEHQPEHDPSS